MTNRKIISVAAFFAMTAVILGAFGAHWLKKHLGVSELATFETGVRYQMYHSLFLLFVALVPQLRKKTQNTVVILVTLGIILFSGSIYLLATNGMTNFDFKIIGFITPIGGLLLIISWFLIFIEFMGNKNIK